MKDKNLLLSQPHMVELVKFVNRLRERDPNKYVPHFDPEDGGVEAEILFLFKKPGPMTDPSTEKKGVCGSGFISQDNEDPTARATKKSLSVAFQNTGTDRKNIAIWNTISAWNGTIEIKAEEEDDVLEDFKKLLLILDKVRSIVLVGVKAHKIEKQIDLSAYQVSRSFHPSRKNSKDLEEIRIIWQQAILETKYRAQVPPQRAAIIEVEHDNMDGRLHRRPSPPPEIRDAAREQRLRKLWSAHCDQLATLEGLDPGRNSPGLGATMTLYRAALGSSFEAVNIIALGVHGTTIKAHAANADEYLLLDTAAVLVGLAKAHDPFIGQFDAWRNYLRDADAADEPSDKAVDAAIGVVRSMREMPKMIADDVSNPLGELAEAAEQQEMDDLLRSEFLRSVGNVLSGLFTGLVDYARDAGSAARKGSLEGLETVTKWATQAIVFAGTTPVLALIAGYPAAFGWIEAVVAFLKEVFSLAM